VLEREKTPTSAASSDVGAIVKKSLVAGDSSGAWRGIANDWWCCRTTGDMARRSNNAAWMAGKRRRGAHIDRGVMKATSSSAGLFVGDIVICGVTSPALWNGLSGLNVLAE